MIRNPKRKQSLDLRTHADESRRKRQRNDSEAEKFQAFELRLSHMLWMEYLCNSMSGLAVRKKPCYFLELPAELRNRIYGMVLGEEEWCHSIKSNWFGEPRLLLVCKQVRKETASIFYSEQILRLEIVRWDISPLLVFNQKYHAVFDEHNIRIRCEVEDDKIPSWQNLLYALRVQHQGRIEWTTSDGQPSVFCQRIAEEEPLESIFKMVAGLRDLPWFQVVPLLETSHQLLILTDERWRV